MTSTSSAEELIVAAIAERRGLRFAYREGAAERWLVEPYVLGVNSDGELMLNGWAESDGGEDEPGFRNFFLHDITQLEVSEERFEPRPQGFFPSAGRDFLSIVRSVK
jgi:predicted DNA-binding transcriptional regulator YafY